jgi:hypothetical protein
MRPLLPKELLEGTPESVLAVRKALERYPDAEAVVRYENQQMDSSEFGSVSFLIVGPSNSLSLEGAQKGAPLGDVPSRFKYPVAYCSADMLRRWLSSLGL